MTISISKRAAWTMWLLISLFYAYQYILRVLPNILMPELMTQFQIDANMFGQFSGLYYIGYAGSHIPLGILLDRKGPKIVIPICILLTVIGLLPLIFANQWIYPSIGRMLIGIGSSAAILGAFKIIRIGFPEAQFTRMLGICVTIGLLGAIYGGQPVNYLLNTFGSTKVLSLIAISGVLLAIFIFTLVPHQKVAPRNTSILRDIKDILQNRYVLATCILSGLMVGPLEGFADVWGSQFLQTVYFFEDGLSASMSSLIFLGMCFGAPLLTYVADKTKSYFTIIIMAGFLMGLSFIYILIGQSSTIILYVLFSIIGVMCSYQIIAIYKASTFVKHHLIGLATSCANMIIMAFGYLFHSTIGFLIQSQSDGAIVHGTPIYTPTAFITGLSIIPIGLLIASFGFMIIAYKNSKP